MALEVDTHREGHGRFACQPRVEEGPLSALAVPWRRFGQRCVFVHLGDDEAEVCLRVLDVAEAQLYDGAAVSRRQSGRPRRRRRGRPLAPERTRDRTERTG